MSKISRRIKAEQLGMSHSTANYRLGRMILFQLVQRLGEDTCFRCGEIIESISDLSIEHKEPWLHADNAKELFFDLNNIAFSHLTCNCGAARQPRKGITTHPSHSTYKKGCRCQECKDFRWVYEKKRRQKIEEERHRNHQLDELKRN